MKNISTFASKFIPCINSSLSIRYEQGSRLGGFVLQLVLVTLLFLYMASSIARATPFVSGNIYREFKQDGAFEQPTNQRVRDVLFSGLGVTVYNEDGSVIGTATSDANGAWSVDVASAIGTNVLVEFDVPDGFESGRTGANNETSVRVVNLGAQNVDFTIGIPSQHSEDNPLLATSCFVTSENPNELTLAAVRYQDSLGFGSTSGQSQDNFPQVHYQTNRALYTAAARMDLSWLSQSRNIGGIAWNRRAEMIYGGVYHKWEITANIGEMGKIFVTDLSGPVPQTSLWLDLNTALGITDVAGQYLGGNANVNRDRANVGYIGFTDVEISEDNETLYVFNAATLQVHAIPIALDGTPAVNSPADIQTFQLPTPAAGTFVDRGVELNSSAAGGLGFNDGRVFATVTITGPTVDDMRGILYSFDASDDPSNTTFKEELTIDYSTWEGQFILISGGIFGIPGTTTKIAPWRAIHPVNETSPWFFDIEFDLDASGQTRMILGTRNRSHEVINPDELYIDPTRGGYMHRAYLDDAGNWLLEENGEAGSLVTGLNRNGDIFQRGETNSQFFHGEGVEGPMMHGTFATLPGFTEVAGMATDNMYGDWDSGVTFHSLSNGLRTRDNNFIFGVNEGYAKGISWGDIEALPELPPLEIGNFVWLDDGDGLQEAGEQPVVGATVSLFLDTNGNRRLDTAEALVSPIATTLTDGRGYYLFEMNDGLEFFEDYIVVMNNPSDFASGGVLAGQVPTTANAASDTLDSDGVDQGLGFPEAPVQVGNFGQSDHTTDFGFIETISIGNLVWFDANEDGVFQITEPPLTGAIVELLNPGGTTALQTNGSPFPPQTTDGTGTYLFSSVPEGTYVVRVTPPAGLVVTIGGADPDVDDSDTDSNGNQVGNVAQSPAVTVSLGGEPTNEDGNANTNLTIDFGFVLPANTVALGNLVFNDVNEDGVFNLGDSPLSGATVTLLAGDGINPAFDALGNIVPSQTTGSNGTYLFTNLSPGDYVVNVTPPVNFSSTTLPADPDPDVTGVDDDSNGQLQTNGSSQSLPVTLTVGGEPISEDNNNDTNLTVDFGFIFVPFSLVCSSTDNNGNTLQPGDILTYRLEVANSSGDELTAVCVESPLPVGTTFVSNSVTVTGASGSGGGGVPTTQTFSVNPSLAIADATGAFPGSTPTLTTSTLNIEESGAISDLNLILDVTHAFVGDLQIDLRHVPTGTVVRMVNADLNCNDNAYDVTFDDEAQEGLVCPNNNANIQGVFQPVGDLSNFNTLDISGDWVLELTDTFSTFTGTLNSWGIAATFVGGASAVQTTTFDFANGQLPTGWSSNGPMGNAPETNWEIGNPQIGPAPGIPTPPNPGAVAATDLNGDYTLNIGNLCLTTQSFDFSNATEVSLSFNTFHDLEVFNGTPFDFGRFEVSTDGGASYTELQEFTGDSTAWFNVSFTDAQLNLAGESDVRFRWCIDSDFSVVERGLYIDDFVIEETVPIAAGPTLGAPPKIVSDAVIADGDTMVVEFQVTVDSLPGVSEIDYSATVSATLGGNEMDQTCALSDPLDLPSILRDYGDAPDVAAGTSVGDYQTTISDNGPSHIISTDNGATSTQLFINGVADADDGAQQNAAASADDADGNDDEDGITGTLTLVQGDLASVDVVVTNNTGSSAFLFGWLDINGDGEFAPSERVLVAVPDGSTAATVTLNFGSIPAGFEGTSYLRLRISNDAQSAGEPVGPAPNGEVEDHIVSILAPQPLDFGDLPDLAAGTAAGDYETSLANDGPNHIIVDGLQLGASVDDETNSVGDTLAALDNNTGLNDEDGINLADLDLLEGFPAQVTATVTNTTANSAVLYGFLDFNGDGQFGAGETATVAVPTGSNAVDVVLDFGVVPTGAAANTYARFRLSSDQAAASPTGRASDGEVEDYPVVISVPELDFGDAPVATLTELAEDGPRHVLGSGLLIGATVDAETDGQESSGASADGADEDGIVSGLTLTNGGTGVITVTVDNPLGQDADLCGWIDFNLNNTFDPSELVSAVVPAGFSGTIDLDFGIVTVGAGDYVLRLRLSSDLDVCLPIGPALDGEVEDHLITVNGQVLDYGDAPSASGYPTTAVDNGARHVLSNGVLLGNLVDADDGTLQDSSAAADDQSADDDEDSAIFELVEQGSGLVDVVVVNPLSTEVCLSGWIDYNSNGSFEEGEQASTIVPGSFSGTITLEFADVPANSAGSTFARLRISSDEVAAKSPVGLAPDGEVEDHLVTIAPVAFDLGDAPDLGSGNGANNYSTLSIDNGPAHVLTNGLTLGSEVDADGDGQPNSTASGDDTDTGVNDEDGVAGTLSFMETFEAITPVQVSNPLPNTTATLVGWVDFDGDGLFEVGESATAEVPAGFTGEISLSFGVVPLGASAQTFARFRVSTDATAVSSPTGIAPDGEIEDHPVTISVPLFDFADAPDLGIGNAQGDYQTLLNDDGPRHLISGTSTTLFIGALVDDETDATQNSTATGDDITGAQDDEDAFTGIVEVQEGSLASLDIPVTNLTAEDAVLWAWLDLDNDGDFILEERFRLPVPSGTDNQVLTLNLGVIPENSAGDTFLRLRLTTDGSINGLDGAYGAALDGEVEDHSLTILPPEVDFGDALDTYGTTLSNSGAGHILLGDGLTIGSLVDADANGIPTAGVDGDDNDGSNDEDGVGNISLVTGGAGLVAVTVNNPTPSPANLVGWIDFDGNGTFDNDEIASVAVPAGTINQTVTLNFGVVPVSVPSTVARLRLTNDPLGTLPTGIVEGGEVEDHPVTITAITLDFADAPDGSSGIGAGNYQTLLSDNGPRHVIIQTLMLGTVIDAEGDASPNANANGDDATPDEDAVSAVTVNVGEVPSIPVTVTNQTGIDAALVGWIDYNGDGLFDNAAERAEVIVPNGMSGDVVNLVFPVVPENTVSTFIRLRISSDEAEVSDPVGLALNGEVEDHPVAVTSNLVVDYGDAPDTGANTGTGNYNTLAADSGPSHTIVSGLMIGASVDGEADGSPNADADGDDSVGADEDGVTIADLSLIEGTSEPSVGVTVTNTTGSPATLIGWIDYNANGVFELSEGASANVPTGSNSLGVTLVFPAVPANTAGTTYARFRLSTDTGLTPTESASDGEVEDYVVSITTPPTFDWGDAADPSFPTLVDSDGPNHLIVPGLTIGSLIDADDGTLQNPGANADDNDNILDEDGIVDSAELTLVEATVAQIQVSVTNNTDDDAILYGWIDFDGDNVFDSGERTSVNVFANSGVTTVTLTFGETPTTANSDTGGSSVLRLRLSSDSEASNPTGAAADGEVEDHIVTINVAPRDFGDAPDSYGTTIANNGPNHIVDSELFLGLDSAPDAEVDGNPALSANAATGDDTTGIDDEDGVISFDLLCADDTSYSLEVNVTNATGETANLVGWIDLDGSGTFEADEAALAQVGVSGTVTLNWTSLPGITAQATSYVRFRLSTDDLTVDDFIGAANDGEVEDYELEICSERVAVGNLVFIDVNNDGVFNDSDDTPVEGVLVQLYEAGDVVGVDAPIAEISTGTGALAGCYTFEVSPGNYFVHIPASEFNIGASLDGFSSITGSGTDNDEIDDNAAGQDNGIDTTDLATDGISSEVIILTVGGEPTGEAGKSTGVGIADENFDSTIDFGFTNGVVPKPNTFAGFAASNSTALGLDDNTTPGVPVVDPLTGDDTGVTSGAVTDQVGLTDNPDGDIFNNLLEFALCYDPGSGAKNFPTGERNEGVQLVHNTDGSVDIVYSIPTGITEVTYQLESSVDGQVWTAVSTTPTSVENTSIAGVSTVTVAGVDTVATDGALFRLRITAVAATPEVTAFSPVVGLQVTRILDFCQTYSEPTLLPCPFSGEVESIVGQVLTFADSVGTQDLTTVLDSNRNYYVEVIDGTGLGNIFDITGFTANTVTLAEQTLEGLCSLTAPFNTLVTVPDLAGSQVIIREHRTIGDLFPAAELDGSNAQIAGSGFTRGADANSAAILLRWNRTTNALDIYYLNLAGDWLNTNGGGVVNDFILPPGEGIFVHDLEGATSFDLIQCGDVRLNQLAVPLKEGLNFVSSSVPVVDQSPDGTEIGGATSTNSRQLNTSNMDGINDQSKFTITGDNAVSAADQVLLWGDDALTLSSDMPAEHYDFLFLLSFAGQIERWVEAGAADPLSMDNDLIFEANRSIFMDVQSDILEHYIASPISND